MTDPGYTINPHLIAIVENTYGIKHFEFMGDALLAATNDKPMSLFTVGRDKFKTKASREALRAEAQAFLNTHRKLTQV